MGELGSRSAGLNRQIFEGQGLVAEASDVTSALQLEKYRPHNINDVVGNKEAVARLRVIAEEGNMPNLILAASGAARRGRATLQTQRAEPCDPAHMQRLH